MSFPGFLRWGASCPGRGARYPRVSCPGGQAVQGGKINCYNGKETAEVFIVRRRIIEDQLSVALYNHSKTDFFLTIKTSNSL